MSLPRPSNVLLLSTYELGHQPHGLASPLAFLRRAGIDAVAQDLAVDRLDEALVASARVVGISVPMHTALRLGVRAAERVRKINPAAHICFYGLYAPLNRAFLLAHCADSVVGGEYEAELTALIERVLSGAVSAPADVVLARLDFATPLRGHLPIVTRYAELERADGTRVPSGHVEASRGCLHLCRHCPIPAVYDGRFFVVPVEVVLADVAQQVEAGVRHISFGDADFLNGPNHALAVARAVHARFESLSFDVTIKVEHILKHREIFAELASLGCAFVVSAIESRSDEVLRILDKGHTRDDIDRAIDVLDAAGIPMRPTLVAFTPWTTPGDYVALVDWILARDLTRHIDPIQLAIRLLVPPGSKLLELDEVRAILGPLDEARFSYSWRHADARMDALYARVSRLVAEPNVTFEAIATLAREVLELPASDASVPRQRRGAAPRLTEAWFCCAEPSDDQFDAMQARSEMPNPKVLGNV